MCINIQILLKWYCENHCGSAGKHSIVMPWLILWHVILVISDTMSNCTLIQLSCLKQNLAFILIQKQTPYYQIQKPNEKQYVQKLFLPTRAMGHTIGQTNSLIPGYLQ